MAAPIARTGNLPKFRIGWYLTDLTFASTSARYRCFHFARILDRKFENHFFSGFQALKNEIARLDAVIIVNRLDRDTIDLAALARQYGKPLFLDLCDDLPNLNEPTLEEPHYALTALLALAPALSAIVVPSAEMAERVDGYLASNGFSGTLTHVVPDIAETRELLTATEQYVRGENAKNRDQRSNDALPGLSRSDDPAHKIIWFGEAGSAHANFGMFSLRPTFGHLREFHQNCPIELAIISESVTIYETLVDGCNFPTRYVNWSPWAVYDELAGADAALLTTGTDEFSAVRSSSRILQALAASVPVIADKSPALAEFEEILFTGKFQRSLEECLGPNRETFVQPRLSLAASVLRRYTPEQLAGQWSTLLDRAIGRALIRKAATKAGGTLLVLDEGDDPDEAIGTITALNQMAGRQYGLLVSTDLLENNGGFRRIVHRARTLPMFFSGPLKGLEGQILRWSEVAVGDPETANARALSEIARQAGIEVLTHAQIAQGALERFTTAPDKGASAASRMPPGPYAEHRDADGSVDWAFVIHDKSQGWILDAICREIGSRQPRSWVVVDQANPPPRARNIFLSHFSLLELFDIRYPDALAASNIFVWYTHPRKENPDLVARYLKLFNHTSRIIFTCESNRKTWIERGLDPKRAAVVLGAADPILFRRHERGGGGVGLSSSFYERKNPDLMLDVVKALPHRNFTLLGRHWNRYARFEELLSLPNFTYLTRPYRDYPRIYATFDVFLSISSLEGGPIPLIEAMMCNAVPVASLTGFAPDVIDHGRNGFLFDIEDGPEHVSDLIERAFALDADVRDTVEQYSWHNFSAEIVGMAK